MITENYQKSSYRVYWKLEEVVIRSADKGARMPPEAEPSPVDRSEKAIRAFPWLVAALPIVLIGFQLIEEHWGDTKFVTYLKTGRMDGAMSSLESTQEFDGNRGNAERDYAESPASVSPQIGQEWIGSWGSCGYYNNPDVLVGMNDPNGDGVRDSFDPSLPTVRTAWDMVPIYFAGSAEGPFYIVINDQVVEVRADLSDPRFIGDANSKGVCKVGQ